MWIGWIGSGVKRAFILPMPRYFRDTPPPGTLLAKQERERRPTEYRIAKGDTLSEIADRYQVSLAMLRRTNAIRKDNLIRVGQVLVIPET